MKKGKVDRLFSDSYRMSKIYKLHRSCIVKTDIDAAWNFIRSPKSLQAITPDDFTFEIITELPEEMYNGLLIEFRVGVPLIGQQTWLTEIKYIREKHSFIDEQRIGPYKLWHHYHEIRPESAGVRFIDHVHYSLPFGLLGTFAHAVYVKKALHHIFDYRETMLCKLLDRT